MSSHSNPEEVWFFPDRESALKSVHFVERDILALHEQWLGKHQEAWSIANGPGVPISFEQATSDVLDRLTRRPGKVVLTLNGAVGDCSWDNPDYYLFQSAETLRRLTSSEQTYRSARASREMLQVAKQVTITEKAGAFFAMCMGLDNRELLPPFTPLGRAEEIAFGSMLSRCFGSTYVARLPWALLHAPVTPRLYGAEAMFAIGFNGWIPSCISLFDPGFARTPSERLYKLGQFLKELGRLPEAEFAEFARQHMWHSMTTLISSLEERLQNSKQDLPDFWVQDARASIAKIRQSSLLPIDQFYALPGGQNALQHLLQQFGCMLEYWPAIVETARDLRAGGYRLAQPI